MPAKHWYLYMKLNGTTSQIIIFSGYVSLVNIMAAFSSTRLKSNNFIIRMVCHLNDYSTSLLLL
jgi:hypothetical protein